MPSVASKKPTVDELKAYFPLTFPVPSPKNNPDLLTPADIYREEDLLRNPTSFRSWWTSIHSARDAYNTQLKTQRIDDLPAEVTALLGPLATPLARTSLQRITYLYESALVQFPTSFKLWKSYLLARMSFVLGKQIQRKKSGGRKKLQAMKDALVEETDDLEEWEGGLDPIVGWEEWKALVTTFERALMWLPKLPKLWLMYLSMFFHPKCPPLLSHSHARHTFDRALRTLPPSLHARVWVRYLLWAESKSVTTTVAVYRRYLLVDPSITERFTGILLAPAQSEPRPLEAAKLLLSLARKAARGEYTSPEGKSPYQLLGDWLEVVEKFSDDVGLDVEETIASNKKLEERQKHDSQSSEQPKETESAAGSSLIRFAGPPVTVGTDMKPLPAYDPDEDPLNTEKLNIEAIIQKDGLEVYKDQAGKLWTGLATYWIKRGEFDRAKETFEKGLSSVLTIRDFTQIFDAYAEFCESLISALMEGVAEDDDEDDEDLEGELDGRMKDFEELMDRRPFLVNDVLIRRNENDVQEWEKRVALWGNDDDKVAETYNKALVSINPRKATANLHRLYINFAKFYEEGGTTGEAEPDLDSARKIFEKATKVNFKAVEDLAEVWCEWSEMELRQENYDEAIRVMQRGIVIPKNTKISYHDHSLPSQARLFKSLKIWSFYVDLEESIGTVETTKKAYDQILELKIANAQVIVNYAAFLEENDYFEESFKVYERGVEVFTFPISFEIWNIYLSKFVKRYGGTRLERTRDLFEQALDKCPAKFCKPIFLMYAQLEEDFGLAKRAMSIYDRATQAVNDEDKFEMFSIYIAKAAASHGLPATRPIYERALEVLPDRQTAVMCLRFANLERKLGEIDRARALYAHGSQFCDPRVNQEFWKEWNTFEIETGSEETFREMLRIKRSVQALFNTEASYLAARTVTASNGAAMNDGAGVAEDAMAAAERDATKGPAFVSATTTKIIHDGAADDAAAVAKGANQDEIHISDDDDDE
jgi:pre-mRNA-splicing factor SYF1